MTWKLCVVEEVLYCKNLWVFDCVLRIGMCVSHTSSQNKLHLPVAGSFALFQMSPSVTMIEVKSLAGPHNSEGRLLLPVPSRIFSLHFAKVLSVSSKYPAYPWNFPRLYSFHLFYAAVGRLNRERNYEQDITPQ